MARSAAMPSATVNGRALSGKLPGTRRPGSDQSMIPKSVQRFSEKIMLKQEAKLGWRFEDKVIPL
jgi:hypothetical protein